MGDNNINTEQNNTLLRAPQIPTTNRFTAWTKTVYIWCTKADKENNQSVLSVNKPPASVLSPTNMNSPAAPSATTPACPRAPSPQPPLESPRKVEHTATKIITLAEEVTLIGADLKAIRDRLSQSYETLKEMVTLRDSLAVTKEACTYKKGALSEQDKILLSELRTKFEVMKESLKQKVNLEKVDPGKTKSTSAGKKAVEINALIAFEETLSSDISRHYNWLYEDSTYKTIASWVITTQTQPAAKLDSSLIQPERKLDKEVEESLKLLQKVSLLRARATVLASYGNDKILQGLDQEEKAKIADELGEAKITLEKEADTLKSEIDTFEAKVPKQPQSVQDHLLSTILLKIKQRDKEFRGCIGVDFGNNQIILRQPKATWTLGGLWVKA